MHLRLRGCCPKWHAAKGHLLDTKKHEEGREGEPLEGQLYLISLDIQILEQHSRGGPNRDVGNQTETSHKFERTCLLSPQLLRPRRVIFLYLLFDLLKFFLQPIGNVECASKVEGTETTEHRDLSNVHLLKLFGQARIDSEIAKQVHPNQLQVTIEKRCEAEANRAGKPVDSHQRVPRIDVPMSVYKPGQKPQNAECGNQALVSRSEVVLEAEKGKQEQTNLLSGVLKHLTAELDRCARFGTACVFFPVCRFWKALTCYILH